MNNILTWALARIHNYLAASAESDDENAFRKAFGSIGENVHLRGAVFSSCKRIEIGDHVYIGPRTNVIGRGGVRISDHAILGPDVLIMSSMHNWSDPEWLPYDNVEWMKPVSIGKACWIGARAIIMPGVKLGDASVVGAGAVVTKSFEAGVIVAGNPARAIRVREPNHIETCFIENRFYLRKKSELGLPLHVKIERPFPSSCPRNPAEKSTMTTREAS